jgi:hypothetical protein
MTPRFLLAKYVPDLNRMEPRNIGVILWARGEIQSRFLSAGDATFVNDPVTYEEWVTSWQATTAMKEIAPRHGAVVSKRDPSCMDAMLEHQEGNYLLVDAGELLNAIPKKEIAPAVDFLFNDLVAHDSEERVYGTSSRTGAGTLSQRAAELFARTGLSKRKEYKEGYKLECPVYGVKRHLKWSFAMVNGHPQAMYQVAKLGSEQSTNSAALMIHSATDSAILPPERVAALIQESDINSETAEEGLKVLQRLCRVIAVDSSDADTQLVSVSGAVRLLR